MVTLEELTMALAVVGFIVNFFKEEIKNYLKS